MDTLVTCGFSCVASYCSDLRFYPSAPDGVRLLDRAWLRTFLIGRAVGGYELALQQRDLVPQRQDLRVVTDDDR
ncbi:hypothetical protein RB614_12665 [Phytohabitans sp. ZYX-F-186]|uniref:Uncharacterized protein n=1 Tax=Phytohabitans maris TaxID=3071409 RepID=A0ABU0ZEJ7_9ACTN|nr:hypothetical protein [Phytohabitans sp. ZYX-F-186]MDQ7905378.1 hypothetical protein [Phytohabitans sp. ZYX-F-186]